MKITRRVLLQASSVITRARDARIELVTRWNEFANAANLLMEKERAGEWDLRQVRRVEKLWERLTNTEGWKA